MTVQRPLPFDEPTQVSAECGAREGPTQNPAGRVEATGHPFIAQLAELCRRYPTRAKWVFVPTHAVGHTLGDCLARDGASWVNLRFVTPLEIAIRMAGPFLVERGINPSEDALGPPLMMRLLLERSAGTAADAARAPGTRHATGYFSPMAEQTTLATALWSTVRELRFAGIRTSDLVRGAFESAAKHEELVALIAAYEMHLEAGALADMPLVLEEAPRHLDFCPILANDLRIELPDVVWAPIVRRFLDLLPGERVVAQTLHLPGVDIPRRVGLLAAPAVRLEVSPTSDASRLRFLRAPELAGSTRRDESLQLFHAGGSEAEVEEVFRRVAARARQLDEVEIVCASDTQALLAWEKARRVGWPVTLAAGVPATFTRPGRAVLAWCRWIEGGFAAGDLRRLLQSGDVAPAAFGAADGERAPAPATALSPLKAARLLLRAEAAWGRETYARSLGAYAGREEARARLEDGEGVRWRTERAAQTRRLLGWIEGMIGDLPVPDANGDAPFPLILDAAVRFIADNVARRGDLDAAAQVALLDAVANLRSLGSPRCPLALALRYVQDAV